MSVQLASHNELVSSLQLFDSVLSYPHSDFVITKDLTLIDKRNFSWKILCLFQPFYQLFGKDVYSHVRANRVAQEILRTCRHHQKHLNERPILAKKIETQILQRLKDKTHGKYDAAIDETITQLRSIIRENDEQTKEEPIDESFVNPLHTDEDLTLKQGRKFYWPIKKQLEILEISEDHLKVIQDPLRNCFRDLVRNFAHDLRFIKQAGSRKLQLVDFTWKAEEVKIVSETEIPFSLEIVHSPKNQISDVIILAKKILAEGGQTKVRLCYSMFRNKMLVRKSCQSETQESILKHFLYRPSRGIVPIFHLRSRKNKKMQVIEPLLDCDLSKAVNSLDDTAKMSIAKDLLYGIYAVHELQEAHRDLKPKNILVQKVNGVWRGFITDFGFTDRNFIGGSLGFRSPEQIHLEKENIDFRFFLSSYYYKTPSTPYHDRIKNQPQLSQQGDMWSMGLVLFHLFASKPGQEILLPLFILENIHLNPETDSGDNRPLPDTYLRKTLPEDIKVLENVLQSDIDSTLTLVRDYKSRETQPNNRSEVLKWWVLIGQMIRKKPEERISSEGAIRAIVSPEDLAKFTTHRNARISVISR